MHPTSIVPVARDRIKAVAKEFSNAIIALGFCGALISVTQTHAVCSKPFGLVSIVAAFI
jgi:hypothetical protein